MKVYFEHHNFPPEVICLLRVSLYSDCKQSIEDNPLSPISVEIVKNLHADDLDCFFSLTFLTSGVRETPDNPSDQVIVPQQSGLYHQQPSSVCPWQAEKPELFLG